MLRLAVIGAGPVGLSLALHAARALPRASITLYDARPLGVDPARDPRTLAMSLGSIQLLQRLKAWRPEHAQPIATVHVSQQAPRLAGLPPLPDARVLITAESEGVPQLGAVLSYGRIVAPLERVWIDASAREPARLTSRFGCAVASVANVRQGTTAGVMLQWHACGAEPVATTVSDGTSDAVPATQEERFDLVVVAEGGVFADQARKSIRHDYRQTAWVGKVGLVSPTPGVAYERFTSRGPAALLPLPPSVDSPANAALVWCVPTDADPVRDLDDAARLERLNSIFHADTGRIGWIGPLKHFALGLNAERTLTDGRIVRIGNAAQTLHPVAGQGLNLGMRDAFELVRRLAVNDVDAALRAIEWGRAVDRWAMIGATDFLARSFTWNVPGLGAVRGAALSALQRAGPVKSAIARRMMFGQR